MPIKASKEIKAKNVVEGSQVIDNTGQGVDESIIKAAAETARESLASGHSSITAAVINADNVVEGFQFIKNPAQPTLEELRLEIAAKTLALSQDPAAPLAVQTALATVQAEATQAKPEPSKLVQTLEKLSSTLKNVTDAAPNVLKVAKWVPTILLAVKAWAALQGIIIP